MSDSENVPPLVPPAVPPPVSSLVPPVAPPAPPVLPPMPGPVEPTEKQVYENLVASRARIKAELGKVIIGQHEVVEQLLLVLIAGGHCLITGAPGLAKTLLVKSIAQIFT